MIEALLASLWQGALIVGIAAGITACIPQRHAATRYTLWYAALLALVAVPAASVWHPAQTASAVPITVYSTTAIAVRATENAASANGSWLLVVWMVGTTVAMLRLVVSYIRIRAIKRRAISQPEFGDDVAISNDIAIPIAAGIIAPVVLIPSTLATTLERADIETIVQHERAHIRRMDVAGNLLQRIIEACLFFNPWVYLIGRQLIKEREAACDDWAVHASGDADRYASCLAHLALARNARTPLLTPSAIGSKRMLLGRIARLLLNGKVTQLKPNYAILGATATLFAVLAFAVQMPNGLASGTTVAANNANLPANCWRDVKVLTAPMPGIPDNVGKAHAGGESFALVTVSAAGRPLKAMIAKSSGVPEIDKATVDAAMGSTYSPELKNCKAVQGSYMYHLEVSAKP